MVAFQGSDPIGVLIGAKRPTGTLIHKIAVHPAHQRQGHGRHLLDSLGSKLAILGPPRIVAEIPETLASARALFDACGYVQEAVLTDYVLERDGNTAVEQRQRPDPNDRGNTAPDEGFVIPVTVDDLAANGLLDHANPQACWERSVETLTARRDEIAGLAVASDERLEAYLLYAKHAGDSNWQTEIASFRSIVDDGGVRLQRLLSRLPVSAYVFPKVHPTEVSKELLEALGFQPAAGHLLYATRARPE
jgi:hypothetical protein